MDFLERNPLPEECKHCTEVECDVCDIGLERWYIPHDLDLRIQKKGLLKALDHEKRHEKGTVWIEERIKEIDQQLLPFTADQVNAIECRTIMTKQIFDASIDVCIQARDFEMQDALYRYFPAFLNDGY